MTIFNQQDQTVGTQYNSGKVQEKLYSIVVVAIRNGADDIGHKNYIETYKDLETAMRFARLLVADDFPSTTHHGRKWRVTEIPNGFTQHGSID